MKRIRTSLAVLPMLALVAACSTDAAGPAATGTPIASGPVRM